MPTMPEHIQLRFVEGSLAQGAVVAELVIEAAQQRFDELIVSHCPDGFKVESVHIQSQSDTRQFNGPLSDTIAAASTTFPSWPTALIFVVRSAGGEAAAGPAATHTQPEAGCGGTSPHTASSAPKGPQKDWKERLFNLCVNTVKAVLVLEAIKFTLTRLRLVRYCGRRERWGPGSDFVDDDSDDADLGTSSEVVAVLEDHLTGSGTLPDLSALRGRSREGIVRGLRKLDSEALEALGVSDRTVAAAIRATAERIASGGTPPHSTDAEATSAQK